MVREIENQAETGGKPYAHLRVLRLPSDPTKVAGLVKCRANPKHQISLHMSGNPMEIEHATQLARHIAQRQGVEFIWIDDPKGLFRRKERAT